MVQPVEQCLVHCFSLAQRREVLFEYWDTISAKDDVCGYIITNIKLAPTEVFVQFLLDCSALPEVASLAAIHGNHLLATLFKLTRTYCYSIHRERMKILNLWKL